MAETTTHQEDISADVIRLWLKVGNLDKLEQTVLDGYGDLLKGKISRLPKINRFLMRIPQYQVRGD